MRIGFGECVFDSGTRQLLRQNCAIALSPKAYSLLEFLLENRPRAVSKEEIHDRVWPGTFVSDTSLARLTAELRVALGDDAHQPRYVRTIHGFGYAFAAATADDAPGVAPQRATCRVLLGEAEISLPPGEHMAGRAEDALIRISSFKVSRHHARFVVSADGARVEDLGSKNGTYVRGRRIAGVTTLMDGDEILIGPVLLVFRLGPARSTETDVD